MTELIDLFLHLVKIEGTSLAERRIADEVTFLLGKAGIRVLEDGSAAVFGGNTGNLLCFPPQYNPDQPAIVLTAHLDTVRSTANLKPIVDAGSIRSDGSTILGGDNRLALAVLARLLMEVARNEIQCRNFFVGFTVGEEIGLYGAGALDLDRLGERGCRRRGECHGEGKGESQRLHRRFSREPDQNRIRN